MCVCGSSERATSSSFTFTPISFFYTHTHHRSPYNNKIYTLVHFNNLCYRILTVGASAHAVHNARCDAKWIELWAVRKGKHNSRWFFLMQPIATTETIILCCAYLWVHFCTQLLLFKRAGSQHHFAFNENVRGMRCCCWVVEFIINRRARGTSNDLLHLFYTNKRIYSFVRCKCLIYTIVNDSF